jgi:hypothetical protein
MFFEGQAQAARERRKLAAFVAWHSGAFAQTRKLPSLADFMAEAAGDEPPTRRKTPDELWQIARAWNAHLGGREVYRDTN